MNRTTRSISLALLTSSLVLTGCPGRPTDQPSFALFTFDDKKPPPEVPGFHVTGRRTVSFLDPTSFTVYTYERNGT